MKTKTIMLALGCLMAFMMQSCAHLEELEDCNAQAFFETETEPDCPAPCEVRFINSSIGRYSSVRWTLGDNSPAVEEDGTFTHTYDTAGEYNVVLTVFADGCPPVERTGSVLIGVSAPIPRFTADTNRCTLVREDCTINFINHSENSDRYEWYVDGVLKGQSENFTHTFTEADTFTVSLAAFNKEVRRDASAVIIIRPLTFKIKGYDLDNDASEGEAIYGVDEAGSGGYYLMMNNNIACYMAITDVFGELDPASVIGRDLGPNYSLIQPNTFVKAPNGYLLAGRAVRTNFNYDLFVFRATSAFNFAGIKTFFEPFEGANEDAYGGAATDAGNYLLFGQGTIDGQQGAYLAEVNTSLTSLVS
ncbi:MAG: PKD domain-containing protein, partial [Phaeodactylibacter sp.]|nr:PKD domain-containing protein [Phaeodactylibacter sp.]